MTFFMARWDEQLGAGVDRAGRLVENQDVGSASTARAMVSNCRWPCEMLVASSPARSGTPPELPDEPVGAGRFGGRDDLLVGASSFP
jgi:hypothetical protein